MFLLITIFEVFYYNYGFIFFSFLELSDYDIVKYSLYNKIFLSAILFTRIPADISIHLASDYYHKNNLVKFRTTVLKSLQYALPLSFIIILPFIFL